MAGQKINPILAANFRGAFVGPLMINLVSAVLQPLAWPLILIVSSLFCFWVWSLKPKPKATKIYDAQGKEINPASPLHIPGQQHAASPAAPPPVATAGFTVPLKLRKAMFFAGLGCLVASLITGILACKRGNSMSQPAVDWIAARFDQLDEGQAQIQAEQEKTTTAVTEIYELMQVLVARKASGVDSAESAPGVGKDARESMKLVLLHYAESIDSENADRNAWIDQLRAGEYGNLRAFVDREIQAGRSNLFGLYLVKFYIADESRDDQAKLTSARVVAALRPDDGNLQDLYAYELYQNEQYDLAIHHSREAIRAYLRTTGSGDAGIPHALNRIGYAYKRKADPQAALDAFRKAEQAWEEVADDEDLGLAETLEGIAYLFESEDDYDRAVKIHSRVENIYRKAYGDTHQLVAETLDNIAHCHNMADRYASSIRSYREAEQIYRRLYGNEHETVANMLYEIGMLLYWSDDLKGALAALQEAERIWSKGSADKKELAQARERIAKIKQELDAE